MISISMIWWCALVSFAQGDPLAERQRLEDEIVKLAQRNAWTGVDRVYRRLITLSVPLSAQDHYLGGSAALTQGETLLAFFRFRRVVAPPDTAPATELDAHISIMSQLETIRSRYGLVSLYVGENSVPVLFREAMPFMAQERDAIATAQRAVSSSRSFRGFLPEGQYAIDDVKFEVKASADWLVVTTGKR